MKRNLADSIRAVVGDEAMTAQEISQATGLDEIACRGSADNLVKKFGGLIAVYKNGLRAYRRDPDYDPQPRGGRKPRVERDIGDTQSALRLAIALGLPCY